MLENSMHFILVAGFLKQISKAIGVLLISSQHLPLHVEGCLLLILDTLCLKDFLLGHEKPLSPHKGQFRSAGSCPWKQPSTNARKELTDKYHNFLTHFGGDKPEIYFTFSLNPPVGWNSDSLW